MASISDDDNLVFVVCSEVISAYIYGDLFFHIYILSDINLYFSCLSFHVRLVQWHMGKSIVIIQMI